jgi:hypothetical protein
LRSDSAHHSSRRWPLRLEELGGLPYRDVERSLDRIEEIKARRDGLNES